MGADHERTLAFLVAVWSLLPLRAADPLPVPDKLAGTLAQFRTAVAQAKVGQMTVMTFHGVPDIKHPWVNTDLSEFDSCMHHLKVECWSDFALRDVAK